MAQPFLAVRHAFFSSNAVIPLAPILDMYRPWTVAGSSYPQHHALRFFSLGGGGFSPGPHFARPTFRLKRRLSFDVAMSDAAWLDNNPLKININWTGTSADQNACKIQNYRAINRQRLAGQNWDFTIHRYRHRPAVHGGLINESYLILGIARWEEGTMKAGDRTYYYFAARDGEEVGELIDVFKSWFHFCFDGKPDWHAPLPPAGSPGC